MYKLTIVKAKRFILASSILFVFLALENISLGAPAAEDKSCQLEYLFSLQNSKNISKIPIGKSSLSAYNVIREQGKITLTGNPIFQTNDIFLKSGKIIATNKNNNLKASGGVKIEGAEILLGTKEIEVKNKSKFYAGVNQFQLKNTRSYGDSKKLYYDESENILSLESVNYSACSTRNKSWYISSSSLNYDENSQDIYGRNAVLWFYGVPVFYSPYYQFSLLDRKSGLLAPEFVNYRAIDAATTTSYIKTPVYFNLAPNYDLLTTFYLNDDDKELVDNELRFLNDFGFANFKAKTNIKFSFAKDKKQDLANLEKSRPDFSNNEEQRYRVNLVGNYTIGSNILTSLDYTETSDKYFFVDNPVDGDLENAYYKQRSARLDYVAGNSSANIVTQDYLELRDQTQNIYYLLPGIQFKKRFDLSLGNKNLDFDVDLSSKNFKIDNKNSQDGVRNLFNTNLKYQYDKGYFVSMTSLRQIFRNYELKNKLENKTTSLNLYNFSLQSDAKLVFKKLHSDSKGDLSFSQTLEPKVTFLYNNYVNQELIPLFETVNSVINYHSLFSYNRFVGFDRVSDDKKLTLSLENKFFDNTASEFLSLSLAQDFYLEDRKVFFNQNEANKTIKQIFAQRTNSGIYANIFSSVNNIFVYANFLFDDKSLYLEDKKSSKTDLISNQYFFKFNFDKFKFLLNFYKTLSDPVSFTAKEEISLGSEIPIYGNWSTGFYQNRDISKKKDVTTIYSLNYDSCCWRAQTVFEKTNKINNDKNSDQTKVSFFIEFKGLTHIGDSFGSRLREYLNF